MARPQDLPFFMQEVLSMYEMLRRLGFPSEAVYIMFHEQSNAISCGVKVQDKKVAFLCEANVEYQKENVKKIFNEACKFIADGTYKDEDLHAIRIASSAHKLSVELVMALILNRAWYPETILEKIGLQFYRNKIAVSSKDLVGVL